MSSKGLLQTLRSWLVEKKTIDESEPGFISVDDEKINLNDFANFQIKKEQYAKIRFTMQNIYILVKSSRYSNYTKECKTLHIPTLLYGDSKALTNYLTGVTDTLEGLIVEGQEEAKPAEPEQAPVPEVPKIPEKVEKPPEPQEIRPRPTYTEQSAENKIRDEFQRLASETPAEDVEYELLRPIDSVLVCSFNFSEMLKLNKNQPSQSQTHETRPELSFIDEGQARKFTKPIIIVPMTDTCAINHTNIKSFLLESVWKQPEEQGDSHFTIKHMHTMNNTKTIEFEVVADPAILGKDDWKHVVAIFLSGYKWQLNDIYMEDSNSREPDVGRLFKKYLGIYVYFENDQHIQTVEKWHVKLHKLLSSRYSDAREVAEIWREIEEKLRLIKK